MGELRRRRPRQWRVIVCLMLSLSLMDTAVPIVDASSIFLDRKLAVIAAAGIFGGRRGGTGSNDAPPPSQLAQHGGHQPPPPPLPPGSRTLPLQRPSSLPPLTSIPESSANASDGLLSEPIEPIVNSSIPHPPNQPLKPPTFMQPSEITSTASNPSNGFWSSQQQLQSNEIHSYQEQLFYMHRDLEAAYIREQQLLADLHNLTAIASEAKQREKLHMHQLDVLTERVIDVETAAAQDHNRMLEYQMNCTELFRDLEMQQRSTDEWREKCESLMELHEADEGKIRELQEKVKTVAREAEALATMIEKHRLLQEGAIKKKKKIKLGFFAWLFSFGASSDDEDDDYTEIYDEARSSLLAALQAERNSVSELESALVTLQQNNSAISEQVQSRDQIIDELNNRIAVFEEDKVVLKAALRQLQLEMNDEAPKTHKLVEDLARAESEVERLSVEIDVLMDRHRAEVSNIQLILNEKIEELKAAESNLTIIGTYVEKLEERLADFTVARREVEERELACSKLENKLAEVEDQRETMQGRIQELEKEHDELKGLLSELADERSKLIESAKLSSNDRSTLEQTVQSLRQSYAKLDNEARDLREQLATAQLQLNQTETKLNEATTAADELLRRLNASETQIQELRNDADRSLLTQREWQAKLDEADLTKHALDSRIEELESSLQTTLAEYITYSEETKKSIEKLECEIQEARKTPIGGKMPSPPFNTNDQSHIADNFSSSLNDRLDSIGNSPRPGETAEPLNASDNIVHALVPVASANISRRHVPLRKIRKFFAKATGVHGLFVKPTHR